MKMAQPDEVIPPASLSIPRRPSTAAATDGSDTCRICRGEATPEQPLFYPCKCSGSIRYVHQDCLMEWLSHSQKKYCELCKTPFKFTKLYDESMPESVPWLLFLRQLVIHTFRANAKWSRYAFVTFIWLFWLPWTIRQIWRALFWIADGSWLTTQELEQAVQQYAAHVSNDTVPSFSAVLRNSTITGAVSHNVGLFPTLLTIVGLFNPHMALQTIAKTILQIAIWPVIQGEPMKWERAFLYTPIPRPPSLLSDFKSLRTATNIPFLNNSLLDVLEGQLICLTIIAAFILVFLIREWVINQQPLLGMPENDQAENPAPAQARNEPRQPARRRHRGLRGLRNDNVQLENRPMLAPRARGQLAPRRRATDNNILVPDHERPNAPQRAQSLVPALQELEFNVRQLNQLGEVPVPTGEPSSQDELSSTVDSPPLSRGAFDDLTQIRREIEETSSSTASDASGLMMAARPDNATPQVSSSSSNEHSDARVADDTPALIATVAQSQFTFRPSTPFNAASPDDSTEPPNNSNSDDADWISDNETEVVETPQTSSASEEAHVDQISVEPDGENANQSETDSATEIEPRAEPEAPDSLLTKVSKWLWNTDEFVPVTDDPPALIDTEIIADINAQPPFVPVERPEGDADPEPVRQDLLPNPALANAAHAHVHDPNGLDDAEDLEGVMELIGMEGPVAGMIQNIIFSVFLITLTLSASVWCPYIWGKIALLFIAHPISVLIKAPLFLLSKTADFIIDVGLFTTSLFGIAVTHFTKVFRLALHPFAPQIAKFLNTKYLENISSKLSSSSGTRLEKSLSKAFLGFRPDLPTFSVQAHHVQRVLARNIKGVLAGFSNETISRIEALPGSVSWRNLLMLPVTIGRSAKTLPNEARDALHNIRGWFVTLQHDLRPLSFAKPEQIDYSLVQWSAWEKIACVLLGYSLFAVAGYLYLKIARRVLGLNERDKVPGMLADTLRQAGGVLKVVVIIGIEMIVFPLYCGTMLDIALLPVFEGANLQSRLNLFTTAPFTALFIHWFLGTCYMFHFALFVSMCRKVMRKGVLYFIRDPDDPTFHPVRDVLERPVATQLGKIAFSGFVYGSLLLVCLGGVVKGLSHGNILPLRWGSQDPVIIIPGDIIFYNFMLPVILRKVDLSKRLSDVFEWWFRGCAAGLRLSDFLFGVDNDEEKQPAMFLWRRFIHVLFKEQPQKKHPMVKYIEDLASKRERLYWFHSRRENIDEAAVRSVVEISHKPKIINLSADKKQALVQFDEKEDIAAIARRIEAISAYPESRIEISKVGDLKAEYVAGPVARKTAVDPTAGSYVRAPSKDSVRIPKGSKVFLHVDERNRRLDGEAEPEDDQIHSKKDDRFSRIFVPDHFRARITTFIALIWIFVALSGLVCTITPLLLGRTIMRAFVGPSMVVNDLYALTVGIHASGMIVFAIYFSMNHWKYGTTKLQGVLKNTQHLLPAALSGLKRAAGLAYLAITIGLVLPLTISLLAEVYINIPAFLYLVGKEAEAPANPLISSTQGNAAPVIHFLQTWAMGLLYLRIIIRLMMTQPSTESRAAVAVRSIIRDGLLKPDVRLASRALILPILSVSIVLLGLPLAFSSIFIAYARAETEEEQTRIYRYSYPAVLGLFVALYLLSCLRVRINDWRVRIRDEVYLIGERLHNFTDTEENKKGDDKGKAKGETSTSDSKTIQEAKTTDCRKGRSSSMEAERGSEAGGGDDRKLDGVVEQVNRVTPSEDVDFDAHAAEST